ncbi:MAG TPA: hypothetical protein VN374_02800 [Desulfitobacteriaceae bacterium]|nr:hypothetical protein [Desulfitobacteriaceae bacterium]
MSNLKTKLASQLSKSESMVETENQSLIVLPPAEDSSGLSLSENLVQVVPEFAISFAEAKNRLQLLQKFVQELMLPGIDYGLIPGCPKPSLLKPGAEKLCDIYGFSKLVEITNRHEEWEKGFFSYEVKATLINKRTGNTEAEGLGNCNSKERKYKNQDAFNISNTILKMAKKRAIVDAVLSATRSSGIFSQDIEDIDLEVTQPKLNNSSPRSLPIPQDYPASKKQLADIFGLIANKKIPIEKAKSWMMARYKVDESRKLTSSQADDFLAYLRGIRQLAIKNA